MGSPLRTNGGTRVAIGIALLVASLAAAELLVRALGVFQGPPGTWDGACMDGGEPDTPLNHAPHAGTFRQRFGPASVYGELGGREYDEVWDEHGIKRSALRPQDGDATRVLFLGDSFIQGYDDANTVPQRVWEWIDAQPDAPRPLIVLNAGYTSYSPVIFTVQAKRLLPALRPDFVVVDVDETDLFDDAVRYRDLTERDASGAVVAVHPNAHLAALRAGASGAVCTPSQVLRIVGTLYYRARLALHEWWSRRDEDLFVAAGTPPDALTPELRDQMDYFSRSLDELLVTLKRYLPADRILVARHPHRSQLTQSNVAATWNRQVGNLVGAAARRNGVGFFDAQDELEIRFGGHAERYYWPGDMHFNFDGIRAYGELVGRELLRLMAAASSSAR